MPTNGGVGYYWGRLLYGALTLWSAYNGSFFSSPKPLCLLMEGLPTIGGAYFRGALTMGAFLVALNHYLLERLLSTIYLFDTHVLFIFHRSAKRIWNL